MEDGVVFDAADKTVECLRLNTKSAGVERKRSGL